MSQAIPMKEMSAADLQAARAGYKVDLKYGLVGTLEVNGREVKVVWYGIEHKTTSHARGDYKQCTVAFFEVVYGCCDDSLSRPCRVPIPDPDLKLKLKRGIKPSEEETARPSIQLVDGVIKWTFPGNKDEDLNGYDLDLQERVDHHDKFCEKSGASGASGVWGTYGVVALVAIVAFGCVYREQVGAYLDQYR